MELGYGCEPTVLSVAQSGATRCPKDQARPLALGKDAQPIPMLHPDFKVLLDLTSFLSVPTPLPKFLVLSLPHRTNTDHGPRSTAVCAGALEI